MAAGVGGQQQRHKSTKTNRRCGLHRASSPPLARRSQRFRASPRQRAMAVAGLLRVALRRGARRCSGRASDPSRSPLCAASARGECALCLHVRVRALAAIMCMMCIACQTLPSIGSPFSFTACLCRRDDSTWSMTRWAPSEAARLFIVRSTSYGFYLHFTVHGLRRSCSGGFVMVIASLAAATVAAATVTAAVAAASASAQNFELSGHARARGRVEEWKRPP